MKSRKMLGISLGLFAQAVLIYSTLDVIQPILLREIFITTLVLLDIGIFLDMSGKTLNILGFTVGGKRE